MIVFEHIKTLIKVSSALSPWLNSAQVLTTFYELVNVFLLTVTSIISNITLVGIFTPICKRVFGKRLISYEVCNWFLVGNESCLDAGIITFSWFISLYSSRWLLYPQKGFRNFCNSIIVLIFICGAIGIHHYDKEITIMIPLWYGVKYIYNSKETLTDFIYYLYTFYRILSFFWQRLG